MDISPIALVSASTQMQQSQVAQTAQILVLKKGHGHQGPRGAGAATGQATLPLAPSGNLGTQVNTMA